MTDFGDTAFNFNEPMLTHSEASMVTGVAKKNLGQWHTRGVIPHIGEMHRTGRRLYSGFDLIELRLINDLTTMTAMQPKVAAAAAKYLRERAGDMSLRDKDGELLYKSQAEEDRRLAVVWFEKGSFKIDIKTYSDRCESLMKHSIPFPQIVIPLDDIVIRVQNEICDLLEREHVDGDNTVPITTKTDQNSSP